MLEWIVLLLAALRVAGSRRGDLIAENLLLRHQHTVLTRPTRRRPRVRFRRLDRLLWVLVRRLRRDWRRHLVVVKPDTVVRWHRAGWRLYWRWRSRSPIGRPRLSPDVQALIARMADENPLWGSERIRGELLKLGLAVSNRSIRRYRWPNRGRPPSQTWRTFLRNHAHAIWAADLCVVQTLTFKTLYVLPVIAHGRRELVHLHVTAHRTAAWVWRQVVEATAWGKRPKHLLRDRDAVYGRDFQARAKALSIETILTPVRSPRANAVAERVIGTLRRDCLDHVLILNEQHLRVVLAEYVAYYNADRPHRSLALAPPTPASRDPAAGWCHRLTARAGRAPSRLPPRRLTRTRFSRPTGILAGDGGAQGLHGGPGEERQRPRRAQPAHGEQLLEQLPLRGGGEAAEGARVFPDGQARQEPHPLPHGRQVRRREPGRFHR
jgi:transposase InsO family protein